MSQNKLLPTQPANSVDDNDSDVITGVLFEQDAETVDGGLANNIEKYKMAESRKVELVWHNIISFGFLHVAALYGAYLLFTSAMWQTIVFALAWYIMAGLGVTAGAHRLWSHRAYKAKWPLRVILIIFNAMASQNTIYHWVRDHRVHHKYSDTDADPHNSTRGFFFSHIGWLLCRKHPEVQTKGNGIDLSDLKADPIVMFQKKYYGILMPLACFIVPTLLPTWFWNESLANSWFGGTLFRWCVQLNVTFLLNSAAHKFGDKPYDKHISPTQMPSLFTMSLGEGWHNYHHAFPWDYKSDEFGNFSLNLTASFIDYFAKIGWAYDLKTVPSNTIKQRMQRTGDGSHATWG